MIHWKCGTNFVKTVIRDCEGGNFYQCWGGGKDQDFPWNWWEHKYASTCKLKVCLIFQEIKIRLHNIQLLYLNSRKIWRKTWSARIPFHEFSFFCDLNFAGTEYKSNTMPHLQDFPKKLREINPFSSKLKILQIELDFTNYTITNQSRGQE